MRFDMLDFPTAWEIQKATGDKLDHHPRCSSIAGHDPLSGPHLLCDCGAVIKEWERRREADAVCTRLELGSTPFRTTDELNTFMQKAAKMLRDAIAAAG